MMRPSFKYSINHYLGVLTNRVPLEQIHDVLLKQYGISAEQFQADRSIEAGSQLEIPLIRLMVYSRIMAIPIEVLITSRKTIL